MRTVAPEPLRFPRGLRLLTEDEIRRDLPAWRGKLPAKITTGYVVGSGRSRLFAHVIAANVHADVVWAVFRALADGLLPNVVAPAFEVDQEPLDGPETDKGAAIAIFAPYVEALQHDGHIQVSLSGRRSGRLEGVAVRYAKQIEIYTDELSEARAILEAHGIPEVPRLQFIERFPFRTDVLMLADGREMREAAMEGLQLAFSRLPRR